jgi:hypothetical protein
MAVGTAHRPRPVPALPLPAFVVFGVFSTFHNAHPVAGCPAPATQRRDHADAT